jgi:hypothetical protein
MKREIKLKELIIALFNPAAYQEKIMRHERWHAYEDTWAAFVQVASRYLLTHDTLGLAD